MKRSFLFGACLACTLTLITGGSTFGQGRVNTNVDSALKASSATGRPILAIAGKKT